MKDRFKRLVLENIKAGIVFNNPGGGTSAVIRVTPERITYRRGKSNFSVKLDALATAYARFSSLTCSTNDLKEFDQSVYSSEHNGHGCNCTFLFSLLHYLGLSSEIKGGGVPGRPFYVNVQ